MTAVGAKVPVSDDVRRSRRVLAGAAVTALGGLLFGYDTGVVRRGRC